MANYWEHLQQLVSEGNPFVAVTLVDVVASAPAPAGAKMLVTERGLQFGTIGGGKLELKALAEAQAMLAGGETRSAGGGGCGADGAAEGGPTVGSKFVEWNLQRDVGMTCGGAVRLYFEAYNVAAWRIVVFGAGHCSQALVRLLLSLRCQVTVIDPRPEWLAKLPATEDGRLRQVRAVGPMEGHVKELPKGAYVVLMTMGHASDQPVLIEILKSRPAEFPYIGVIGSKAKAAALRRGVLAAGVPEERLDGYCCPIGLPIGTNDPAEIAVSVAAQLLEKRDAAAGAPNAAPPAARAAVH
jgi:xanthine dehydrogenase accessory factor